MASKKILLKYIQQITKGKSIAAERFIRTLKNKIYKTPNFNIKKCVYWPITWLKTIYIIEPLQQSLLM